MTNKEKLYEAVKKRVQLGIDKFYNATVIRDVFDKGIEEAKAAFPKNRKTAEKWVNAMKAFRDAALIIWMQNPDYDEFQVLEKLMPNGELAKIIYEIRHEDIRY